CGSSKTPWRGESEARTRPRLLVNQKRRIPQVKYTFAACIRCIFLPLLTWTSPGDSWRGTAGLQMWTQRAELEI
ncbi:unnamed protein product, partial [Gulo gulo]